MTQCWLAFKEERARKFANLLLQSGLQTIQVQETRLVRITVQRNDLVEGSHARTKCRDQKFRARPQAENVERTISRKGRLLPAQIG